MPIINIWQLLAGLGIFLYGMFQLEDAMKQLAGRTFKLFLRKHTEKKLSAILSGTVVTAVLQSSSVVTLMVLSFVGAGVISMRNALAVVFGSNLGTTLDSWVVAMMLGASLFLGGIALIAFLWGIKTGQFDDAKRMMNQVQFDDEKELNDASDQQKKRDALKKERVSTGIKNLTGKR